MMSVGARIGQDNVWGGIDKKRARMTECSADLKVCSFGKTKVLH